jgi:calcineurin-like phosphoesterase family protein
MAAPMLADRAPVGYAVGASTMLNIWFTADFHLGHANIIRYCGRPFADVATMDTEIIDRLNSAVAERDVLYFLGDFSRSSEDALLYRKRIRCKNIFFIEGNHDRGTRKIASEFRWWKQLAEAKVNGQVIVLCHYAMRVWHHSFRGSWHLYGHSHGRLPDDPASLSMDVGVDTHDFRPWHFDEIAARMNDKATALRDSARHEAINNMARMELEAGTYDTVVLPDGAEDGYQTRRDAERKAALDSIARDAFESGLYDRTGMPESGEDG